MNPLIVQADRSILVDVHAPRYDEARRALARFAELEKSPEHMHTYRLTPLALWNAAASGLGAAEIQRVLAEYSRYPVPQNVRAEIDDLVQRFGRVSLSADPGGELRLRFLDAGLSRLAQAHKSLAGLLQPLGDDSFKVAADLRGKVKRELLKLGHPVDDRAGFTPGRALALALRSETRAGRPLALRPYQRDAVAAFMGGAAGEGAGGHGVIVLPCGAGKTLVGMAAMAEFGCETLILATSITSARQWISELVDKTDLSPDLIGEYSGERKELRPVTVATYQILTHRKGTSYPHFARLAQGDFGLVIYDEVHLLPAPVFRLTAEIQARRRLGLTATLVREDNLEGDVFSLIGPKRFDMPWKDVEAQGFIAEATCYELRVPLTEGERGRYEAAEQRQQHRIAATGARKLDELARLVAAHDSEPTLVIGTYLDQLHAAGERLTAAVITGETPQATRERLLGEFRAGQRRVLVLSRVGNFSIDLPDASVCIQLSGSFGSRQEEAQRLGRVLRPKAGKPALFYSLVGRDTVDQDFAMNRQLFLTEQGYRYYVEEIAPQVAPPEPPAAPASASEAVDGALGKLLPFVRPADAEMEKGVAE